MDLPPGVYGFTSSPVLASPLFATARFRNFEVHRLADGPAVVGFVTPASAERLATEGQDIVTIQMYPDAEGEATALVCVPYHRIVQHRQYSVRNAEAVTLQVRPQN